MSEFQMLFQQLTLYLGVGGLVFLALISLLHICERVRMRLRLQWRRGSRANIVCFVLSAVIATVCAQKGGDSDGDANGAPPRMMAPRIVPTALDVDDLELPIVSNLCISAIEPGSNSVAFSISWPVTMPLASDGIDLFATWDLLHQPWFRLAEVDVTGATSNAVVEIAHTMFPTNAMAHTAFYLAADQGDSDQDGLSDAYERLVSGSSPVQVDSDVDGIADGEEIEFGANPNAMDSDGDGILDGDEIGFCTVMPASSTNWKLMSNGRDVWSNTSISDSGSYVVNLPCPYTVNGVVYSQIRICVDGVVYLLDPEQPEEGCMVAFADSPSLATAYLSRCHVAIATFCTDLYVDARNWGSQVVCGSANLPSGSASVIDFYNMGFSSDVYASNRRLFSYQLVLPSEEPNTFYLTYWPIYPASSLGATNVTIGVQCPMLFPLRSDERYYNLTWKPAGGVIDNRGGVKFTIGRGTNPASADSDDDGFSDSDEIMRFQTNPNGADDDSDGDGLPDATELRIGSNPQSADSDCDGVDDCEEFLSGTDPLQPDTDNDGMNDGWELTYDGMVVETLPQPMLLMASSAGVVVRFDPLVNNETDSDPNNNADADPDGDGLTNAEECALGTNPCRPDTDDDGVDDHTESEQGSDPMDSSDKGLAGSRVGVAFYFGDHSGSHSEKYRLSITPVQGVGNRPSAFSWLNENYGECETKTAFLKPGWKYEVRLTWAACNHVSDGSYYPNYDYTLRMGQDVSPSVVLDDPGNIFRSDYYGSEYYGASHFPVLDSVATITVYEVTKVAVCNPDDQSWVELEDSRVVLDDEELRIKVEISPQVKSLAQCRQMFGDALIVKTSGTCPSGVSVPIGDDATMNNSADKSEIRITKTRQQLISLGLLPARNEDGVNEMVWVDIVQTAGQSIADSEAFSSLGYAFRGKATLDETKDLDSSPPNSQPSHSYMKAGGCEILTAMCSGVESNKSQIMNQADVFYYSGHGNGATGGINRGFTPNLLGNYWKRDLNCVVIAGCSVMNIAGHRIKSFGMTTRFKRWYRNQQDCSVGAQWENVADAVFLGYCYTAPLDSQGAVSIASEFVSKVKGGMGFLQAWKEANDRNAGRNACALDCTTTPHKFWYWDETSGSPVWTQVEKGTESW